MRFDPEISEWGNLMVLIRHRPFLNKDRERHAIPGEVKHLSNRRKRKRIDSVSSGERKRNSLNSTRGSVQVLRVEGRGARHGPAASGSGSYKTHV